MKRHFRGQIAVIMTFAIATLLGAMALGTDVAVMYFNWVQLQKGADAAALAGAFYLTPSNSTQYPIDSAAVATAGCGGQPDDAGKTACMYAVKNKMAVDAASLKIYEPGQNLPATAPKPNIQVWVKQSNLPYFFGKVRLNTYSVSAISTAQGTNSVGTYTGGLFPTVFECAPPCTGTVNLAPGTFVSFGAKFTAGANGNWGWLDVGQGPGGAALGTAIANGIQGTLKIGDAVSTKPGATWGPIQSGFATRMSHHNSMPNAPDPNSVCNGGTPTFPAGDPLLVTPRGGYSRMWRHVHRCQGPGVCQRLFDGCFKIGTEH
jgi:Putative Flp pilus-assembly TadE/G-like